MSFQPLFLLKRGNAVAAVSRRVTALFVDSLSSASGHVFEAEVEGAATAKQ